MIKLFKGIVQELLLVLVYLNDRGYNMQDVRRGVMDEWGGRPNQNNKLQTTELFPQIRGILSLMEDGQIEADTIPTLIESLTKSMKSTGTHSKDLIDSLVAAVMSPFTRNVMSGPTLSSLRKALLLPDEARGLTDRLKKREMSCSSCGHEFTMGEAVVTYFERETVQIVCFNCSVPSFVRCVSCDGNTVIPVKLRDGLQNTRTCDDCKSGRTKEKQRLKEEENLAGALAGGAIDEAALIADGPVFYRAAQAQAQAQAQQAPEPPQVLVGNPGARRGGLGRYADILRADAGLDPRPPQPRRAYAPGVWGHMDVPPVAPPEEPRPLYDFGWGEPADPHVNPEPQVEVEMLDELLEEMEEDD